MNAEQVVQTVLSGEGRDAVIKVSARLLRNNRIRKFLIRRLERGLGAKIAEMDAHRPRQVQEDKRVILSAILGTIDRAMERGNLSPAWTDGRFCKFLLDYLFQSPSTEATRAFAAQYGQLPPGFLVLSPYKGCNLHCQGCYADSGPDPTRLEWAIFDRIIGEAKEQWGARFFVFSGGEPLAYRSEGKGVLDAVERHNDCMFLMYTNGTLINGEVAQRMAEAGNITPAISVEGMRTRTDARRGEGVFDRVLAAMANLRESGVPFGISITATRENCEEILSDEFLDFFFEEQGADYGWIFQFTPIGRGHDINLMPTPQQRMWMWRRTWEVVKERQILLPDFWTFGTVSDGCISAGREGGYLYIDWNGKVMPCVFFPYAAVNIKEVYACGGTLTDAWAHPFFAAIRRWQREYAHGRQENEGYGNWLMPCPFKDHHLEARAMIDRYHAEPEDEAAAHALSDVNYDAGLAAYDEALSELSKPVWQREYMTR